MPETADKTESIEGAQSFLKTIKDFWELCASILAAIAAVVAASGVPRSIQIAAYAVAALFLLGGGFYAHRKAQRRLKLRKRAEAQSSFWEQTGAPNPAFRGLYSYQEGDVLPGRHRQVEALRIATQLSQPGFRFGIIGGDVGCGKTSLLRCAVQKLLKERDWGVLYVSSSAELFVRLSTLDAASNGQSKPLVAEYAESTPDLDKKNCALILDQFEEVFIRYPEAQDRKKIASIIKSLLDQHPNWRLLCAVRHEHVIDFQEFSPILPDTDYCEQPCKRQEFHCGTGSGCDRRVCPFG